MKKIIGITLILIAIIILYYVAFTDFLKLNSFNYIGYIFALFFLILGYNLLKNKRYDFFKTIRTL